MESLEARLEVLGGSKTAEQPAEELAGLVDTQVRKAQSAARIRSRATHSRSSTSAARPASVAPNTMIGPAATTTP